MKTDGNIVPPPSLTVEKRVLEGQEVVIVKVEPSNSPPVRYKGVIHVRTGPRRGIATAKDERILNEKRRYGDRPFTHLKHCNNLPAMLYYTGLTKALTLLFVFTGIMTE